MFIKLAFVILLSVEIEACNVRVRKIPANISDRLLRDPFTKKLFLKWATFSNFIVIRNPKILSSNPADGFSKTISDERISMTIFKKRERENRCPFLYSWWVPATNMAQGKSECLYFHWLTKFFSRKILCRILKIF